MTLIMIRDDATNYGSDVTISDIAKAAVVYKFNPSGLPAVDDLKLLAAAFITRCDELAAANPEAGRIFAVAKTNMETAVMWAVKGATKHL